MSELPSQILVVDSHTGGEPTRTVIGFGTELGTGSLTERKERFAAEFDHVRSAIACEPRGSDTMVGAMICQPSDPECVAGVIFFNNVGYLGMCGHGTIGVVVTMAHLGEISPGEHKLETPVGVVTVTLHDSHRVTIKNVPSFRTMKDVVVDVPGEGEFVGDVAWAGNWFFLVKEHSEELTLANEPRLTDLTWNIRQALIANRITGDDGGEIDHIELFGPPVDPSANSRNFVLCPGRAYDRSPCGTGTSAKLACLMEDGVVAEGEVWRQESICGSIFEAEGHIEGDAIRPRITGSAWVTAETQLLFDSSDPLGSGIRS